MSDVTLREPDVEDAEAIAELLNAHARALHGESELAADEVRHWFTLPNIWIRVAERDDRLVGYLDVQPEPRVPGRWDIDARALDADVIAELLAAAEQHARANTEGDVTLRGFAASNDDADRAALEARGFAPIRSSFQMRIELPAELPPAQWPEGIAVRTMRDGEEERVYEANQESFEDHWDHHRAEFSEWRHWSLDSPRFDPTLWFIAEDGGEIAGISLCSWHFSGDPQFGWVNVLGVRRPWRKRGLGLALLQHALGEFKRRDASRVGLGVDAENPTGAVRLYERAGMMVARRNDTWQKKVS